MGLGGLPTALSAEGCSAAAPIVRLDGFPQESVYPQPFYWVEEQPLAKGTFLITAAGGCGITIGVDYATHGRTASSSDFTAIMGREEIPTPADDSPESRSHDVEILDGELVEDVAEWFDIVLSNASPPVLDAPSSAPMFIIDDDGPSRVAFGLPSYTQSETFPDAVIPVFRAGDRSGPHTVNVTVTPGPTNPATPGQDFTPPASASVTFHPEDRVETIRLGIVNDKEGEAPEDLTITLEGAGVETPSSTVLTILDNEEKMPPKSRFHHPRNKWKYNKADYRIREFHIFATDEGGSGVVAAEMALRRNLANGKCAWKVKKGWQRKGCQNRIWLPTKYDDVGELSYYRMKQLKSSVGTKIKSYTAFSRAIDGAGNVEKEFKKKRNMNTFEIRRKGKTRKA